MGERRPPSSRLPAAWGAAARSARLAGRGRRRRWRERGRGAFQSGAGAASRVDRVLGVRMNGRVVLRIFWKWKNTNVSSEGSTIVEDIIRGEQ